MKSASLILCISLALSTAAAAQQSTGAQANATGDARANAAASKEGANVSGAGSGSASATTDHASAQVAQGTELNATLTKPVDARKAKPGDEVTATSNEDIKSNGKVAVRKGSKLIGHVTTARPLNKADSKTSAEGRGDSQLGIVFDRAVLKDGTSVPLHATVQALAAVESTGSAGMNDVNGGLVGAGGAAGSARSSGGGLIGGVSGGVSGAADGVAGRTGGMVSGTASGSTRVLGRSAGAIGGLNAAGNLSSGSKGVFGLKDVELSPAATGNAEGSIMSSARHDVKLDRGTRMLLVNGNATGGAAGSAAAVAGESAKPATQDPASPPRAREPVDNR